MTHTVTNFAVPPPPSTPTRSSSNNYHIKCMVQYLVPYLSKSAISSPRTSLTQTHMCRFTTTESNPSAMSTVRLLRCYMAVASVGAVVGFSSSSSIRSTHYSQRTNKIITRPPAIMFVDGLRDIGVKPPITPKSDDDDSSLLGNLQVPNVGIGTISWSSTSRT
eukprot:scaffold1484_cov173-Amphora_coffeaeformis.AAC.36